MGLPVKQHSSLLSHCWWNVGISEGYLKCLCCLFGDKRIMYVWVKLHKSDMSNTLKTHQLRCNRLRCSKLVNLKAFFRIPTGILPIGDILNLTLTSFDICNRTWLSISGRRKRHNFFRSSSFINENNKKHMESCTRDTKPSRTEHRTLTCLLNVYLHHLRSIWLTITGYLWMMRQWNEVIMIEYDEHDSPRLVHPTCDHRS
jgi:hypothetical protein